MVGASTVVVGGFAQRCRGVRFLMPQREEREREQHDEDES